jgi:NAD(P)-dependent dehydrogenase (short-subunit alcohol dehydrogenase family)
MALRKASCGPVLVKITTASPDEAQQRVESVVNVAAVEELAGVGADLPHAVFVGDHVMAVGVTPVELQYNYAKLAGATGSDDVPAVGTRLTGKVAIVTGAAQGFGRGIAEELVKQGAAVVVADLNQETGLQTVEELKSLAGDGCAIFASINVAKAESCTAAVAETVKAFGGVDMLVSNAGVLKAGGIEELDEAAFDLVGAVNYKGYFLCVKAVTPVMRLQRSLDSSYMMDIVQINSKSGLEGSKRNFAYAGSKFGAIGLTQSFALELVEDGIKVNSICPGNFFDGPLWSDPERGLFKQYLDTCKVPGATTLQDVKDFYMAKVPMGRGCTPADVATAILYLHDQAYETGQALPVSGGQIMLN